MKILNENFISNKTKHVLVGNELNKLSKKVKSNINNSINKTFDHFSILNGAKYFSSRIFQNYLVFVLAKKIS